MPKKIRDPAIPARAAVPATGMAEVQRQAASFDTEALQAAIFNSANFSCIATDAQGVIQIFNVGAERMLGYSAAEVVNKITPADISDPQELIARAAALSAELDTPIKPGFEALVFKASRGIEDIYELTKIRKDGSRFPAVVSVTALRGARDAIIGYLLIGTDNTARKQIEEERKQLVAELQRSNQDLEQFAYVASHDLQEPLRMVASFTQLLARRYGDKLDQDAQDFIGYAVDGATRMQQLVQDLLAYSRVTTRGAPSAPVEVRGALEEALMNLESAIAESRAVVTADDLPAVLGDRTQVVELLQNLIGNGIKFRRPEVSPRVHLSAQPDPSDDSLWLFQAADNGIGIDPKYADRVFVIFQRLQGRQEYPGTGIGLALCKRIVERHGGTIWLQPGLADGTTVNFTLPQAESESGQEEDTDGRNE
jgi:signal transduction histidine kinase